MIAEHDLCNYGGILIEIMQDKIDKNHALKANKLTNILQVVNC